MHLLNTTHQETVMLTFFVDYVHLPNDVAVVSFPVTLRKTCSFFFFCIIDKRHYFFFIYIYINKYICKYIMCKFLFIVTEREEEKYRNKEYECVW